MLPVFCLAQLHAFDKAPNVRDLLSDIRSQPTLITETIFTLSDENGKITEHPTLRKNIKHFNWIGKTLSVIRYNDAGKPYAYEKLTFTSDGLLSTSTLQTKKGSTLTKYEYLPDFSGWTQYVSVNGGESTGVLVDGESVVFVHAEVDYLPFGANMVRCVAGLVCFYSFYAVMIRKRPDDPQTLRTSVHNHIGLLAMLTAVFSGPFIGVSLSLMAVQHTAAGIASTIMAMTPIIILLPSHYLFHQPITLKSVVGAVVSCIGVSLFFLL